MSKISIYDVVPVPKLADKLIGTSVGGEPEDLTYNFTLGELLNLFIPNIPGNTLQGVLDFGNTATQDINLTGTINTTDLNVSGNLTISDSDFTGETHILGGLYDSLNSIGTPGQVLISTGTQVEWFTIPTVIPNLQQVLASGNTAVNNIILTGDLSANNAALLTSTISTSLTLLGTLRDGLSSVGANNQVLSSTVTGVRWVNLPVYSAASPLLYNSGTGVFSIQQANASQGGFLSAADWITFDGKQTAISLTTAGNSGPSTLIGATINVPNYTLAGLNGVPQTRTLTINGVTYNLSADRSWTISAGVSSVTATSPLFSTGGPTPDISIQQSSSSLDGYLSSVDWLTFDGKQDALTFSSPLVNTAGTVSIPSATSSVSGYLTSTDWSIFNSKQGALTLTTTGTSGPSTLVGDTLNIPQYTDAFVGTVTSVAALTLGTIGTDLSSTVANSTTTPVITLNVPTASAVNRGALSSADWTTFNSKQIAGNYITSLTGEATATGPGAAAVTLDNAAVISKLLTGLNVTGGTVVATDSILTGFGKVQNQINGLIGGSIFQGTWNASTNTPTLTSGVGTNGYYYIVSVAGTTNLDGITDWQIGDWAIFAGTTWEKVDNTDAVSSVNGFTGAVSLTTDNIPEGATNLYFTNTRARTAISLTTTGSSGASTYDNTTGVFNIPNYADQFVGTVTSVGLSSVTSGVTIGSSPITTSGIITIAISTATASQNGLLSSTDWTTFNSKQGAITLTTTGTSGASTLIGNTLNIPNYTDSFVGTVTSVSFSLGATGTDLSASVANSTTTPAITLNVPTASASNRGALSAADWSTFNSKQATISLTTTGNSGSSTFISNVLNVPTYTLAGLGGVPTSRTITINGTTQDLSADRIYSVGTVTSVAALTLGTSGTDLSSSVANSTTTPVITLNVPTASASNRGALSAADWSTFNSKQNTITLTTTGTSGAATLIGATLNIPQYQAAGTYVTSVTGTSPIVSSGGTTPAISIPVATTSVNGYLSSTDWTTFNSKQNALTNPVTGTGTTNYLPKFTGTSTIGNSQIFDDGTNVGIGTGTPTSFGAGYTVTSINGSSGGGVLDLMVNNTRYLTLAVDGGEPSISGRVSGLPIVFRTNNGGTIATRLTISSTGAATFTGNVGIGGGTPSIFTPYSVATFGSLSTTNNGITIASTTTGNGLLEFADGSGGGSPSYRGYIQYAHTSDSLIFGTAGSDRLTISSTGAATFSSSVGIGVTPSTILTINGGSGTYPTLGTATANALMVGRNDKAVGMFFGYAADGNGWIQQMRTDSATAYNLVLQPVGGNVLIGTTTDAGQKFQVSGTGLITGETTFGNAAAGTNLIVNINGVTNKAGRIQFMESGSVKWLIGNGAASENGRFEVYDNVNGTGVQLLRGAVAWTVLSDERFKDIIEPISVNNKLKNIRSVIGKYKTDKEGIRRNFLIAQDLLEFFPEVVDVDENEEKPMGVRYQDLIPILVSAIKELKQEIDTLKN